MHQNLEVELKTLLNREQFEELLSFYLPHDFIKQENYYYRSNHSEHYAYRIRVKEGQQLFTLKQHVDGGMMEYEKVFTGKLEDDPEITAILESYGEFPPHELLGKLTTYRYMVVTDKAELCFDINLYNGIMDYEVEYEVKKEHDHEAEFKKILNQAGIEYVPNRISKYRRFIASLPQ